MQGFGEMRQGSDPAPWALVINDDPLQLRLTSRSLERIGLRVVGFGVPEQAVGYLSQREPVDLIVTDLHMPGVDGWRLCRLLRSPEFEWCNEVPILVTSATFSGVDAEEITGDLGANAFLPVPWDPKTLERYVRELLAGSRPRAARRALLLGLDERHGVPLADCLHAYGFEVGLRTREAMAGELPLADTVVVQVGEATAEDVEALLLRLRSPGSTAVIVVLTRAWDSAEAMGWLRLGADACVPVESDPEHLLELMEKARRERSLLRVQELLEERTFRLKASDERFQRLFESIPDIVLVLDRHHRVLMVNRAGIEMLGYPVEHLVGSTLLDLVDEPERRRTGRVLDLGGQEDISYETSFVTRSNQRVMVEVHERSFELDGRSGRLAIARDVTRRREAEESARSLEMQLIQAQKLEAMGTLAGGIAHDFNNLLSGILGCANLLRLRSAEPPHVLRAAEVIERAVNRASELTRQLLGFARRGKNQHVPVSVNETLQEVMELLRRTIEPDIHLEAVLDPGSPSISGDPGQIQQILLNLALNGRDAILEMDPRRAEVRGCLSFSTRSVLVGPGGEGLPDLPAGRYVEITVRDDGPGIPLEIQDRIFEPFFTTKEPGKGTGMGLAMVYGIVRNHGGVVRLESAPGEGTAARVLLPESKTRPESLAGPGERTTELRRGRGRVLVVDDEPLVRAVAVRMMRELGYTPVPAASGEEALEYLARNGSEVDLVILDLVMPGLGGAETFRRMKRILPTVKAVLVTGYSNNEAVQELLDLGMLSFLSKPYRLQDLADVLAHHTSPSEPAPEGIG